MSRLNVRSTRLYLLFFSTAFALTMGEFVVRLTTRSSPPSSTLMFSSPHWQLDGQGAVRHIPNEAVRLVSVYDATVEFDVSFRTNKQGLVDHRDYPVSRDSQFQYAFVGDSFTHGMGADPWVPRLRDRLRAAGQNVEIYNLGVNGASVQHFRKILSSMAAELPLSHIVIITISSDFMRPWWVPVETPQGVVICRDPPACQLVRPLSTIINYDASAEEIVTLHRETKAAVARRQPVDALWRRALWQSQLYRTARKHALQLRERFAADGIDLDDLEDRQLLGSNLDAFAGIRADFPNLPIWLVHFPIREEVESRMYEIDLAEYASRHHIKYFPALTECSWSVDMYHSVNTHPNAAGYRNFAQCLSRYLFERE